MPLKHGAKPGSKGFKQNIKTEMESNPKRTQKQAVAIAYSESRRGKSKKKK